jgi:hypothetical protein
MSWHFVSGSKGWIIFHHQSWCCETSHSLWPNTLSSTVRKYYFHLSLCSSINKWETHQAQTSQYPKLPSSSHTVLCSTPVPADIYLTVTHRFLLVVSDFSFVSLSRCTSQVTTTELIGNVCVPIFEVFYPFSDNVRVHAGISISTMKLCVNIQYRDFLLPRHSITASWGGGKNVLISYFLALKYDHIRGGWFDFPPGVR